MKSCGAMKKDEKQCCRGIAELIDPKFFKALCDPNRIDLLSKLSTCCSPCTVGQIAEWSPVNVSVVSRHLAMMKDAGILESEKCGKEVRYSVCYSKLSAAFRELADAIEDCCPDGEKCD